MGARRKGSILTRCVSRGARGLEELEVVLLQVLRQELVNAHLQSSKIHSARGIRGGNRQCETHGVAAVNTEPKVYAVLGRESWRRRSGSSRRDGGQACA